MAINFGGGENRVRMTFAVGSGLAKMPVVGVGSGGGSGGVAELIFTAKETMHHATKCGCDEQTHFVFVTAETAVVAAAGAAAAAKSRFVYF